MKKSNLFHALNLAPLSLMLIIGASANASDTFLDCEVDSGKQVYVDPIERIEIFNIGTDDQSAVIWIENENTHLRKDSYTFSRVDYKKGTNSISSYVGETYYSGKRGDDRMFSLQVDLKNTKTINGRLEVVIPLKGSSNTLDSFANVNCEEKRIEDRAKHANY